MYVPPVFREDNLALALQAMQESPFANLVSAGAEPFATAVPTLVDEGADGLRFRLHLAARNPHTRLLSDQPHCLLIFTGPSCYVSPSWYDEHPSVPTWNYVAVHVYGRAVPMLGAELETFLRDLTRRFEPAVGGDWVYDELPDDFRNELLSEIRGFRVEPSRVEAKSKLSQNRTPEERARIVRTLTQSPDPSAQAVGRWMSTKLPRE